MSYNEKPLLKLYKYQNDTFKLQAIIDDYESVSFEHSKYEAGQFSVQINYNIPNATKFEENMFIQFGNEKTDFGIIKNIRDSIGPDGKGSQIRIITGYDARILFKQRIIRNLNFADSWTWTGNGEKVMRELISAQCGDNAETKRKLPIINIIPETCIGKEYTVSEAYSNLYDVLVTIATQTEIGWQISFSNNEMILEFYPGIDRHTTVRFDTDYNSLANGEYEISTDSYANTVYVGGKGSGENKDVYEGEVEDSSGNVPKGLERFECWDDSSSLENEDEYSNEAQAKLNEYSQMVSLSGNGLAKCPYEFRKQYDIGDIITVSFSGKSAIAQIISITEHWSKGVYDISFEFGKPVQDLSRQLNLLLSQIRTYQNTENNKTSNIKYYEIPAETEMPNKDVILDVIGFIGNVGTGKTFKLYFDNESKVGAKTYHIYFKQLSGNGKLTLTSGVQGATNLELGGGTYVAIIYVDEEGNIGKVTGTSNYNDLENKPVVDTTYSGTSTNAQSGTAVASALDGKNDKIRIVDYRDDTKYPIIDSTGIANLGEQDSDGKNPKVSYIRTWVQAWNYIKRKIYKHSGTAIDADNLTLGTYSGKFTNTPKEWGTLIHNEYNSQAKTYGSQIFIPTGDYTDGTQNNLYYRSCNNGTWNDWQSSSNSFPTRVGVNYKKQVGTFHEVKQLTNSSGTWKRFVILLGKTVNDNTTLNSNLQWDLKGYLISERNASHYHASVEFNAYSGYSWDWETAGSIDTCYGQNDGITYDIGTCVYKGQRYVCLIGFANIQLVRTIWNVIGDVENVADNPLENLGLMINYQTRASSTASWGVVNQEINDSVTPFSGIHRRKWMREANITGSSATAVKATNDSNGNNIVNTYATKTDLNNALTNYNSIKTYPDMIYNQAGYFRMKINQAYGRSLSFILFLGTHSILFTFYKADNDMKISARDLGNDESGNLNVTFKFSTDNYLYFYKPNNRTPSYSTQAINIIGSFSGTVGAAEGTTEELYNNAQKTINIT